MFLYTNCFESTKQPQLIKMRPDVHRIRRKVDNKGSFRKNCIAILVAVILAALVLIYFFYISPLAGKYSGISRGGALFTTTATLC